MNRYYLKNVILMISTEVRRGEANIKEIQTKSTMQFYLTPVRIIIIQKSKDNKCWHEYGEKIP